MGKPYEEDIDYRLEDWLAYECYNGTNDKEATNELQKIVSFNTSGNEKNINTSNALLTVWAYEKQNRKEEGTQWLNEQLKLHPDDKWLLWTNAILNGNAPKNIQLNSNARIVNQLVKK